MEKSHERNEKSRKRAIIASLIVGVIVVGGFVAIIANYFIALNRPYRYKGEHIDLFSVATNNLFGAQGYYTFEFADFDPYIEVLETDDYGRTLFFFADVEGRLGSERSAFGTAIFVMQQSDEYFVYFYQDDCYMPYRLPESEKSVPDNYRDDLPEDGINKLKERNNWNKEINSEKCTKAKIGKGDPDGSLEAKKCEPTIKAYVKQNGYKGDDTLFRYAIFCNADTYGRELYYVYAVGTDVLGEGHSPASQYKSYEFAVIFTPDNACSIEHICEVSSDSTDYYEKIIELKKTAHWDQPLE